MQLSRFTLKSAILCACAAGALSSSAMAMNDAAPAVMENTQTMPVLMAEQNAVPPAAAGITVSGAMAYATATGQKNGVAFFTMTNNTAENDKITGVTSDISETAEIHATELVDDIMQMRKIENFELPAGQTVTFEPTKNHVMLMGLRQPLMNVQSFNVQLTFEKAGTINVPVQVQLMAAASAPAEAMPASNDVAPLAAVPVMPAAEMATTDSAPVISAPEPVAVDESGMVAAPAPDASSGTQGYVSQPKGKKGLGEKIMGLFGK